MPKRVEEAEIALISAALEIEKIEFEAKINISSPDQMQKFLDEETLHAQVDGRQGSAKQCKGSQAMGVDAKSGKVVDMSKLDVVEPLAVKEQIIKSATEAVSMILRIDDIIASNRSGGAPAMPQSDMGM